ncbi:DUF2239 family protein [Candidatus Binatia bacterium]|nr:DUF2239 family protein [Candidatus Binatia bacterium]
MDSYTAFAGLRCIAAGELEQTVLAAKRHVDANPTAPILIFEDRTGTQIDFDLRGTPNEVRARLAAHPHFVATTAPSTGRSGPGRPRLGVVSREVSLLPRHWSWLAEQPGGASAALRRLVDEARKRDPAHDDARRAREAAGRFLWAVAGDLPGFEEASRALFAGDDARLAQLVSDWPADVGDHVRRLLQAGRPAVSPVASET